MKLLLCLECQDVIKLHDTSRYCICGKSGGYTDSMGFVAKYHGPAMILGLGNSTLAEAIRETNTDVEFDRKRPMIHGNPLGHEFDAWVVPPSSKAIIKKN